MGSRRLDLAMDPKILQNLSRNPLDLIKNWPNPLPRGSSEASKKHHEWLESIANTMNSMLIRIKKLEDENKNLKSTLNSKSTNKTSSDTSYASIVAQITKPGSQVNAAVVNAINLNAKLEQNREKRLVVVGFKTASDETKQEEEDLETSKKMIQDLEVEASIVKVFPSRIAKQHTNNANNVDNTKTPPRSFTIEFDSTTHRNAVLFAANRLRNKDGYQNVFIRPDRTPTEQDNFNRLNKERKENNEKLHANGTLKQPFLFVIRGDKVRCIDITKTVTINDKEKHPFVNSQTALNATRTIASATEEIEN